MGVDLSTVTIIGAGTMGHSLALLFANFGKKVFLTDLDDSRLEKAKQLILSELETLGTAGELNDRAEDINARIHTSTEFQNWVGTSDLVIEAIVENVEAKKKLYNELVDSVGAETIISSNTSYLNVFPLVPEPIAHRFLITHFFSPPHIVPLVEVVGSEATDPRVIAKVAGWLEAIQMTAAVLKKYIPGFIVNRLQRAIGREILYMIDEGYAEPQEIDRAVKCSLALRMPIVGVVKRYDFAGIDMALRALQAPSIDLVSEDRVSPSIKAMVEKGELGVKTGKGFYDYHQPQEEILRDRDLKLLEIKKLMRSLGEFDV